MAARGRIVKLKGDASKVSQAKRVVEDMVALARRKDVVSADDINTMVNLVESDRIVRTSDTGKESDIILRTFRGETIAAKTPGQKRMVKAVAKNDIVFSIGPAGTGKTYTSVAMAVLALKQKRVRKIVLCRPAVEAGESLGFLPGTLKDKIDPYLRPLYDALEEMIDPDKLEFNITKNIIEIVPLAYMRGRTLNNAFVILDEAQNATHIQMKMFLTRLGAKSQAIITGDVTQTDLAGRHKSGLVSVQNILKEIDGIAFTYLTKEDVVRHKLIREIIAAYDRHAEFEFTGDETTTEGPSKSWKKKL